MSGTEDMGPKFMGLPLSKLQDITNGKEKGELNSHSCMQRRGLLSMSTRNLGSNKFGIWSGYQADKHQVVCIQGGWMLGSLEDLSRITGFHGLTGSSEDWAEGSYQIL